MLSGKADVARWSDPASFDPIWAKRAELIAGLIPSGRRVMEFGAGLRRVGEFLPAGSAYFHSDLVRRAPDTLVLDLESRPLPSLADYRPDVAVFAGVLEYLSDVEGVLRWLAPQVSACIASYECARGGNWFLRRLEARRRRAQGWISSYTEAELTEAFGRLGFSRTGVKIWRAPEGDEPVFSFARPAASPPEPRSRTSPSSSDSSAP